MFNNPLSQQTIDVIKVTVPAVAEHAEAILTDNREPSFIF